MRQQVVGTVQHHAPTPKLAVYRTVGGRIAGVMDIEVILEVAPDARYIRCHGNVVGAQMLGRANTGEHQQLGRVECPGGDGLWFEAESLQTVLPVAGAESGNVFARFLADLAARRGSAKSK